MRDPIGAFRLPGSGRPIRFSGRPWEEPAAGVVQAARPPRTEVDMRDGSDGAPRCAVLVGPYLSGKSKLFESLLAAAETAPRKGPAHPPSTGEPTVGHTAF